MTELKDRIYSTEKDTVEIRSVPDHNTVVQVSRICGAYRRRSIDDVIVHTTT